MKSKQLFAVCCSIIVCNLFAENIALWQEIPRNFLSGFAQANYKEVPLREFLIEDKLYIPQPSYKYNKSHPRILDIDNSIQIKKRFYPFKNWADEIISRAQTNQYAPNSTFISEESRSEIAKYSAVAYYLNPSENFLEKAKLALLNIAPTVPPISAEGGYHNEGWGDWMQAAEALRNYAVAYDILYNLFSESEKTQIENSLSAQIEQIYQYFDHFPTSLQSADLAIGLGIPKNNHVIDIACGVATACLVIDTPKTDLWLDKALNELGKGLGQILADGSYTEGAYYAQFIASRFFQFAFYYQNATGINLHQLDRIRKFSEWLLDIEYSDGSVPMWDDAMPDRYFYLPLMVRNSDYSEYFAEKFYRVYKNYSTPDSRIVDSFFSFDSQIKPVKYSNKTKFYPDGGQFIFQNGTIESLLLAEKEKTFTKHDHIDPLEFTFYAYGKPLLIDSGYGLDGVNDKNRDWFISPEANNIPLVNGFGPDQNPIWGDDNYISISHEFRGDNISIVQANTKYRATELSRMAILPTSNYMIIIDSLASDNLQRFSIPWQGLGELFLLEENIAYWKQDKVNLKIKFISKKGASLRYRTGINSFLGSRSHSSAEFALSPCNGAKIVSIILPENSENKIILEQIFPNSEKEITAYKIKQNCNEDYLVLSDAKWEYKNYSSDAEIAFIQPDEQTILLKNATWLKINGEYVFRSEAEIDLILELQNSWQGQIENPHKCYIKFFPNPLPVAVFNNNKLIEFLKTADFVEMKIASGSFSFNKTIQDERSEISKQYYPILSKLQTGLGQYPTNLNAAEKNQLRNEIIQYSVAELGKLDSLNLQNAFRKTYGFTTGILSNLWDAEENFGFSLPQKFEISREIANSKVTFKQSGRIGAKGITSYYNMLNIDNEIFLSRFTPFEDYQLNRFDLYQPNLQILMQWQKFQSDNSYLFQSNKKIYQHNYSVNYFSSKNEKWQELAYKSRNQRYIMRLSEDNEKKYRCNMHSFMHFENIQFDNKMEIAEQIEKIFLSQNFTFGNHQQVTSGFDWDENDYDISASLYSEYKNLRSLIILNYSDSLNFLSQHNYYWKKQEYFLKISNNQEIKANLGWNGNISAAGCRLALATDGECSSNIDLPITDNLSFANVLQYDFEKQIVSNLTFGMAGYWQNYYWLEAGVLHNGERYFPISEFVAQLQYNYKKICDLRIFTAWYNNKVEELNFEISNSKNKLSPGIKIKVKDGEVSSAEGYMSWNF